MGWIPVDFWHHLVSQNFRNVNLLVIFSIFHFGGWGPRKVDDLVTSPINQFRDYFIRNRLEKLVPVITSPRTSKTEETKSTKPFSNLDFWPKCGFPKIRDLSPVAPQGVYISRNDPKQNKIWKCQKTSKICIF